MNVWTQLLTYKVWKSAVNLDKLWTLVSEDVREKFLNKQNETAPVIDTLALVLSTDDMLSDVAGLY